MRSLRSVPFLLVFAFFAQFAFAQQATTSVQRDPQATALLQAALNAMGGGKWTKSTGQINVVNGVVEGYTSGTYLYYTTIDNSQSCFGWLDTVRPWTSQNASNDSRR